jgi:hypothetical protein
VAVAWLILSLVWMAQDRVVRDGDEQYVVELAHEVGARLGVGDMRVFVRPPQSNYPPLYTHALGIWWFVTGGGQPSRLPVRALGLVILLIAAWATARLARRGIAGAVTSMGPSPDQDFAEAVTFVLVLALPLATGLARHFMLETAVVAAVAVTVLAAARAGEAPSHARAVVLGLALGAGCLVKQTFPIYAALPVLFAARRQGWRWGITVGIASVVAAPWYLAGMSEQLAYTSHSLSVDGGLQLTDPLFFYPVVLARTALGPILLLALLGAAVWAVRSPHRGRLALGAVWFVGGLLVLLVLGKKYPRLVVPITPAVALCVGIALAHARRWRWPAAGVLVGLALSWWVWTSWTTMTPLPMVERVSRCDYQFWLRAPRPDDLGLGAVADIVAHHPDRDVVVVDGPLIPSEVRTTLHWAHHLRWHLVFEGLPNAVYDQGEPTQGPPPLVIQWEGTAGERVEVPSMGSYFNVAVSDGASASP